MPIINASAEVIEQLKNMLAGEELDSRYLRIAARIDMDGDVMGQGFQLFQSELTLNDQLQEFDGFNIIVANILIQMYGSFTLTSSEVNGKPSLVITPEHNVKTGIYKGATLGTATSNIN